MGRAFGRRTLCGASTKASIPSANPVSQGTKKTVQKPFKTP